MEELLEEYEEMDDTRKSNFFFMEKFYDPKEGDIFATEN